MTNLPSLRGARLVPLAAIAVLAALSFVPAVAGHAVVAWSFRGAAAFLLAWLAFVVTRRRGPDDLKVDVAIRQPHWVQALVHTSIFVYWGWYWRPVYDEVWGFLAQFAFGYAFTALLAWHRRQTWYFGFGVLPIVLSTNLFLWFKHDWYYLQFAMLALGFVGKELVRWRRNGRLTHIFNPSGFALSVVALALLLSGTTHITWGPEIAYTLGRPDFIYWHIFAVGLIVQGLFAVTPMTLGAAAMLWLLTAVYNLATGSHFFVDTSIPIAVFLGLHLLVTDPVTSPRTNFGRLVFGALYGAGVYGLYWLLDLFGAPTFYDKLLCVPLLNLSVRAIERFTTRVRLPAALTSLSPRAANYAHMGFWALTFVGMWSTHALGPEHEGRSSKFWERACVEGRRNACGNLLAVLRAHCEDGNAGACNEWALVLAEGRAGPVDPAAAAHVLGAACDAGQPEACGNLASMRYEGQGVERDLAQALALYARACDLGLAHACGNASALLLQGEGVPSDAARAAGYVARACELTGEADPCNHGAAVYLSGRFADHPVPRDPARAAALFGRACDAGVASACANLGLMHRRGDGIDADPAVSERLRARACELGLAEACAPQVAAP